MHMSELCQRTPRAQAAGGEFLSASGCEVVAVAIFFTV
jgi:hypothetical protein